MNTQIKELLALSKAFAEVFNEKVEESVANILSDVAKFDAQTREQLKEFALEVKNRAQQVETENSSYNGTISVRSETVVDLQEFLDELRAEIARLKAELNNYRQKAQ